MPGGEQRPCTDFIDRPRRALGLARSEVQAHAELAVERLADLAGEVLRRLEGDAQIGVLHFAVHGNSNTSEDAPDRAGNPRRYDDTGVTDSGSGAAPIVDLGAFEKQTNSTLSQLTLTKTASAASFVVGTPASFTLQLSNTGTAATTAASTITDPIPAGLVIGTLPAGCAATGSQPDRVGACPGCPAGAGHGAGGLVEEGRQQHREDAGG